MEALDLSLDRHMIINDYARWCAFSSTRSGSPLKARADVYPLIDRPDYKVILTGSDSIKKYEFNLWHEESALKIQTSRPEICIGWAAKLINVYLKTMVFVASIGRSGLQELIHPPIDRGLWEGIEEKYFEFDNIMSKTHSVSKIKDIETYAQYKVIIEGIELVAMEEKCKLVEVEKLWRGTHVKTGKS